ncbi:MAG: guanylate kinase [Chloroflexi bacterium]|nr:guanylate kinase [Chloroflexota bacterium]
MRKSKLSRPPLSEHPAQPLLIVISGPSGVGKDAILSHLKKADLSLQFITTVTTRPPRVGERDKIDYHFVSQESFRKMIDNGELLEWAKVYGNWYGVPKSPIKEALEKGRDAVVKVDVQGAATIKQKVPEAVFIFIAPPSLDELIRRLGQRDTESPSDMTLRLKTAQKEMDQLPLFDYVVVNRQDEIDRAVTEVRSIITAEKCRVNPRKTVL